MSRSAIHRPSIVLFFFDQLRADVLDHPVAQTPNLDRLAAESVRFGQCLTNAPLCRPARTTLMTGLPVHRHGVASNRVAPSSSLPSHVRALREAGYRTAVVGKTHLHDGVRHLDKGRPVLTDWGFVDAVELPDPLQHGNQSAHSDWLTATTPPHAIDKYARWRDFVVHAGHDPRPPDDPPWFLSCEDHLDSFCARAAAAYVRSAGPGPLYLQVNFPGPHPPFDPPRAFLDPIKLDDPRAPAIIAPPWDPSPCARSTAAARHRQRWRGGPAALARMRARYYGKVALVDAGLGRVCAALKDAGLWDEAWVVVTADHGELLGDHGLTGKVLPYESALRVPLLIRPPGGAAARIDRGAVDLLDVVATVRSVAGVPPSEAGTSLTERVWGIAPSTDKTVVVEAMGYVAVRTADATLVWDRRDGPAELYDRTVDPDQTTNVIEAAPALRARMIDLLARAGAVSRPR